VRPIGDCGAKADKLLDASASRTLYLGVSMKCSKWFAVAFVTFSIGLSAQTAFADHWARYDHPWTYPALEQAMKFCRMQPRINPDIGSFVDMLNGNSIDKCMYALGWVGVAR